MADSKLHLLIVGGGRAMPGLARAHRPDVRISVLCRFESVTRYPDLGLLDRLVALPESAIESDWVEAARFIHRTDPVHRLLMVSELDISRGAAVGVALGLQAPAPGTVEAVDHKQVMRAVLRAGEVDLTLSRTVNSVPDLRDFAAEAGYPLICKPDQGVGSQGVTRVENDAEATAAFHWAGAHLDGLASTGILVEQFHQGTEYSVECLSEAGRHVVAGITAKYKEDDHFVELGHVVPAPIEASDADRLGSAVVRALDALGVCDGVTHTEVIAATTGVHIVETHLRPGGDRIPEMLHAARGIDLVGLLVRQSLGEAVLDEALAAVTAARAGGSYAAVWHACPDQRGILTRVEGVAEASAMEGVREVKIRAQIGEPLGSLAESRSRAAHAWAVADSPELALERARAAAARLAFVVAQPEPAPA